MAVGPPSDVAHNPGSLGLGKLYVSDKVTNSGLLRMHECRFVASTALKLVPIPDGLVPFLIKCNYQHGLNEAIPSTVSLESS
jgi:hypothetical protein